MSIPEIRNIPIFSINYKGSEKPTETVISFL